MIRMPAPQVESKSAGLLIASESQVATSPGQSRWLADTCEVLADVAHVGRYGLVCQASAHGPKHEPNPERTASWDRCA